MSDLIRREDAMMYARPEYLNPTQEKLASYNQGWNNAIEMYYRQIAELPSVEPTTGKWLDHSDEGYVECPFCGSLTTCEDNIDELHYCFNCGEKMEGTQE